MPSKSKWQNLLTPTNFYRLSFAICVLYITFLNILVIKASPDMLLPQFAVLVAVFSFKRIREFLKDWLLFIPLFLIYEFLRGYADDLAPFGTTTLFWVHNLETFLFRPLPTIFLQQLFADNSLIKELSLFFYSTFFYYTFVAAFVIWICKKEYFKSYMTRFLLLTFCGLIFFFLIPTAPPWLVSQTQNLGIARLVWGESILSGFKSVSLYHYFIAGNAVAALPSFHAAWPFFTSLFLIKMNKKLWPSLLVPLGISFAIVYSGEHYLIDAVFGYVMAAFFVLWKWQGYERGTSLKNVSTAPETDLRKAR